MRVLMTGEPADGRNMRPMRKANGRTPVTSAEDMNIARGIQSGPMKEISACDMNRVKK
jgi:hypothetical protein